MADPVSIIGGIIAIAGATGAAAKKVNDIVHKDTELQALLKDVEQAEQVLRVMQWAIEERTARSTNPQISTFPLRALLPKFQSTLDSLNALLNEKLIKAHNDSGDIKAATGNWLRHKAKARDLVHQLRELRQELAEIFHSVHLSDASHMASRFEDFADEMGGHFRDFANAFATHFHTSGSLPTTLQATTSVDANNDQPLTSLTAQTLTAFDDSSAENTTPSNQKVSLVVPRHLDQLEHLSNEQRGMLPDSHRGDPRLRPSSYRRKPCQSWCSCYCHRIRRLQTPEKATKIIGLLSISFSGLSIWNRECGEHCFKQTIPTVRTTYFLPPWFAHRAVRFAFSFSDTRGLQMSMEMPRVRPGDARIFALAVQGDLNGVKQMFVDGEASPYDIAYSTGRGVLAHAITYNHLELAQYLVDKGSDPEHTEKDGRTSVTVAWSRILGNFISQASINQWRSMFDSESYLESRLFPPLHKIVLGIAEEPVGLEATLKLSSMGINQVDAEGRTALSWAAARGDLESVRVLLKYGAKTNKLNDRYQSPLHLAAQNEFSGCGDILRALHEA